MSHKTFLTEEQIERIVVEGLDKLPLAGKRVLVIVPDQTRTMPLPMFFRLLTRYLRPRVNAVDFLVALGTHPPLNDAQMLRLFGLSAEERTAQYGDVGLLNHAWKDPNALATLGVIPADEIAHQSNGLLIEDVPVRINRLVLDYDHILICGPVFPHEVVGFSGGNKYFFPGIAGPDIIDFTHWLGALLTSYAIIGTKDTAVRAVIDRAAAMIPTPRHAICSVVDVEGVEGVFVDTPEAAWAAAADLAAQTHIHYVEKPFQQVLSVLPEMYDEIWVGAKGMYKMEPVIADEGEVIIYAPHVREISVMHGAVIRQIGYHVRDYFVKQWESFKHYPWGVLAHSTHLRGVGTYADGVEHPRIAVTLATSIPEDICRQVNLGYRDPETIALEDWPTSEDGDRLMVPRAGEMLYRLRE